MPPIIRPTFLRLQKAKLATITPAEHPAELRLRILRQQQRREQVAETRTFHRCFLAEEAAALGCPQDSLGLWLALNFHPLQVQMDGAARLVWRELLLAGCYPAEITASAIIRSPWNR